jgi:hypothetical protein
MGQIIDIDERRRRRPTQRAKSEATREPAPVEPFHILYQLVASTADAWRAWLASWGSLWLAPWGLQMSAVQIRRPPEARDRAEPRS